MRITRELYPTATGVNAMAFIKANPWERLFLRWAHKHSRHNLRPSRNWPGLRRHGASWVMVRKGGWNPDTGRKPGLPLWVNSLVDAKFNVIDLWAVSFAMLMPNWWSGALFALIFAGLSQYLQRWRIKHDPSYRL
jgi:hypothetical protein